MTALAITREDFWRLEPAARVPAREWQHFIIIAEGLELLVNFSVSTGGPLGPERCTRVIVIARTDGWRGFVDSAQGADAGPSNVCQVAGHRLVITPRSYELTIDARAQLITLQLEIVPRSLPMIAPAQPVGGGRRLSWLMVPRVSVTGGVEVAGRRFELREAAGYHDHNWGHFAWGDDFCWEWGVGLPDDPGLDDALILSSLQDRARARRVLEQLFTWQAGRNVLAVSGSELTITAHGPARVSERWQLPAVMSLLRQRCDADLPERLELAVASRRGRLRAEFSLESVAELVLPSDCDPLGLVTIHECVGPLVVESQLAGESVRCWRGRGVFEFVRTSAGAAARAPVVCERAPEPIEFGVPSSVTELLQAAIALLEHHAAGHARMLVEAFDGLTIDVRIDDEQLWVATDGRRVVVERGQLANGVRVRTDLATTLALVDDRLELERAVRTRRLDIHAERGQLEQLARLCRIFVHGLVRMPAAADLLIRLRQLSHARAQQAQKDTHDAR